MTTTTTTNEAVESRGAAAGRLISERFAALEAAVENSGLDKQALEQSVSDLADFFESQSKLTGAALTAGLMAGLTELEDSIQSRIEHVAPRVSKIEIQTQGGSLKTLPGVAHKKLQEVLDVLSCGESPMLIGPTGCGKTFLSKQIADVIGVPFGSVSCSGGMTESKLFGRSIPNVSTGEEVYHATEWVQKYEQPGLMLLDEFDALDDNVILAANQALANNRMPLPERRAEPYAYRAKKDGTKEEWASWTIVTANTHGSGADRQYSGRNKLDQATLDRFVPIDLDYDREIERSLCPDEDILERFWGFRDAIREERIERPCSTRWIERAYKLRHTAKWSLDRIEERFFSGWHPDEVTLVKGN